MSIVSARGWNAKFRYVGKDGKESYDREPLELWRYDDEDGMVGYVLRGKGELHRATYFSNFVGYERSDDEPVAYLLAQPGWWVVTKQEQGALWCPVITWLVYSEGWKLHALSTPDQSGYVQPDEPGKDVRFVYKPNHAGEGMADWPFKVEDAEARE